MLTEASDLAQARGGGLSLEPRPVELRAFMDQVQEAWAAPARDSGATLSVSYDGADVSAVVDGARLRQVFDSLIERALQQTRRGGVEASLTARRTDGGLVLEGRVRDSGPAIPAERLARIFEPAMGPAVDGGMGMALSRHIVQAMHGAIVAENNAGAGATIAFNLVAEEAMLDLGETEQQQAARSAHVLVVDDNATNRMVAEALCEMFECTSESVEDGVEAVEAAGGGRFDLILMDIKMPRMDGVEATRRIRAMPGVCGVVPIIALTANADPDDVEAYMAAGMSAVVEKPIKPEALLAAMNACLPGASDAAGHAAAA
jgi:CheY-like chemotaxis protein